METADDHRDAGSAHGTRDVERTWKLVRLDADKPNDAEAAVALEQGQNHCNVDTCICFIDYGKIEIDVRPERGTTGRIAGDAVDDGERVRGGERSRPLN